MRKSISTNNILQQIGEDVHAGTLGRIFGKQLLLHNKTQTRAVASADRNWLLKLIDERVKEPLSLLHWSFPFVLF